MTYVLDGIETAMEKATEYPWEEFTCPCGARWNPSTTVVHARGPASRDTDLHSLRFHYTHCEKARVSEEGADG